MLTSKIRHSGSHLRAVTDADDDDNGGHHSATSRDRQLCKFAGSVHTHNRFTALWILSGTTRWAGTRRNIHPLTPILIMSHPLSACSFSVSSVVF